MSGFVSSFAPNSVVGIITQGNVTHILNGFLEDSMFTVEQNKETWTFYTGADNTSTRIYNSDTSGKITVHLQQTSSSNDVLSALYKNDIASVSSDGMFEFTLKDTSGRSLFYTNQAWVAIVPQAAFANTMQSREWQIHCGRLETFIGGNSKIDASDVTALNNLGYPVDSRWTTN